MSLGTSGEGKLSKNERREAAREKAKSLREEQKKKDRLTKFYLQGGIILASLAIITAVTLVIVNGIRPEGPGPLNMLSDGIKIGQGLEATKTPALQPGREPLANERDDASEVIDIQLYVDYMCPICGQFEAENGEQIQTLVESGAATVEYHPISILDNLSVGEKYSTRAANAAACVANYDPNKFFEFNAALFSVQPEERTPGLTNEELFAQATGVGVAKASSIEDCIEEERFEGWVGDATDRALNGPIPNSDVEAVEGTPTVIVNGQRFNYTLPFSAAEFADFLIQAAGSTFNDNSTPSPEPTPVATP